MCIHIIPAKAPIGVKNAPMLEPMIVEKMYNILLLLALEIIDVKNNDIGILLIKLSKIDEAKP